MLSRLALEVKKYAKQGIEWLDKILPQSEEKDDIYIHNIYFRAEELFELYDLLNCVVHASSDEEIDEYIKVDTIPIGLFFKEEFWTRFQSIIYIWCGEYSDVLTEHANLKNGAHCKITSDDEIYIGQIKIFEFDTDGFRVIFTCESSSWSDVACDKPIRIFKYKRADFNTKPKLIEIEDIEEYLDMVNKAYHEIKKRFDSYDKKSYEAEEAEKITYKLEQLNAYFKRKVHADRGEDLAEKKVTKKLL